MYTPVRALASANEPSDTPAPVFKPKDDSQLKEAVGTLLDKAPNGNCPNPDGNVCNIPHFSPLKFERLNPSEPKVSFNELCGSVIYGVRRMG